MLFLLSATISGATPREASPETPEYPAVHFTIQTALDVLSDYTLLYEDAEIFCKQLWGLTSFDSRTITICSRIDETSRKQVIIHEIVHVLYWKRGLQTADPIGERVVAMETARIYNELYGGQD